MEIAQRYADKIRDKFIPVIVWVIQDTHPGALAPRLSIGFIEEKFVSNDRLVVCDEVQCKIGQHIPDDILARYPSQYIELEGDDLVFSEGYQ